MKKDRNCGMGGVGMMPNYGAVMPGSVVPMPGVINYPNYSMSGIPSNSNSFGMNDISSLTNQVNSLEQRVNRLENLVNNGSFSNNYNSSNYQMM